MNIEYWSDHAPDSFPQYSIFIFQYSILAPAENAKVRSEIFNQISYRASDTISSSARCVPRQESVESYCSLSE